MRVGGRERAKVGGGRGRKVPREGEEIAGILIGKEEEDETMKMKIQ